MIMKDIFGNTLSIGDTVAFNPPFYKGLVIGEIVQFTAKQVRVEYTSQTWSDNKATTVVWSSNVVKRVD